MIIDDFVLPTTKVKPLTSSPENLILFSKPKCGKTSLISKLDDCLILDTEKGSRYLEALKVEIDSVEDLMKVGKAIKSAGFPYKYVAVDTVTALEDILIPYAERLYSNKPQGAKWFEPGGGKEKYGSILHLPNGAGYMFIREAYDKIIEYIKKLAPRTILIGHVKDTILEKNGAEFNSLDLDLTGKIKRIACSRADAIGYIYRKGDKNYISFKTSDEVSCGARNEHLKNQEFVISEYVDGVYTTYWDKIYID
jgi:hypothetical protein